MRALRLGSISSLAMTNPVEDHKPPFRFAPSPLIRGDSKESANWMVLPPGAAHISKIKSVELRPWTLDFLSSFKRTWAGSEAACSWI